MKTRKKSFFIYIGIAAGITFAILDLVIVIWFGRATANYVWYSESISRLGEVGSPMQMLVMGWGISGAILLVLFANAFKMLYPSTLPVRLAIIAIWIYALGEGLGSGLFPIDRLGDPMSVNGALHEILSAVGDVGIVLLPFILMRIPNFQNSRFRIYLNLVILIGIICIVLFLTGKYFPQLHSVSNYKGLWQRIYTFNYHLLLFILSLKMANTMRAQP